jgi:hypothetical protein
MEEKAKKKRGAKKGNANAWKHGFYAKVLRAAEKRDMTMAQGINGIDDEVALLRVKIKEVVANDPENVKLIMEAIKALAGLLKDRYHINKGQQTGFRAGLEKVIKEVVVGTAVNAIGTVIAKHI